MSRRGSTWRASWHMLRASPAQPCSHNSLLRRYKSAGLPCGHQFTRPKRIILIRHGESIGNIDEAAYVDTADWRIHLTKTGKQQARAAGTKLAELTKDEKLFFYVSPYKRTLQTLSEIGEVISKAEVLGIRQEPRMVEQQFGNFQDVVKVQDAKRERHRFGRFFYRFPGGEAGLDVYNRATSFIGSLFRDFNQLMREETPVDLKDLNVVVITHGLTLRLFLMRYFHLTVEKFENSHNPSNAEIVVMEREYDPQTGREWYTLDPMAADSLNMHPANGYSIADAVYGEEDMPLPLPLGGAWELLDKERTIPSDNIVNLPPVLAPDQFFVDELDRIQSDIDGSGLC